MSCGDSIYYGGDEFLVIVHDVDQKDCAEIAERVCDGIRNAPVRTRGGTARVTLSIGIAMRNRGDGITTHGLIEKADQALYSSKRAGRDRVSIERS